MAVFVVACADGPTPPVPAGGVSLAKAPSGPSVNAASPAFTHRDTTLDVHVFGSGFTSGAVAEWSLGGVPNALKIRTNNTRLVNASELIANITVSSDADLKLWDITVFLVGGKKGVGTEKFEVTTATIIGGGAGIGGYVMGTSEQVSVAGYGYLSGAWVFDAISTALVDLGAGQAWGIDPTGTVALGRDGGWLPVVWNRSPSGSWSKQAMTAGGVRGNVTDASVAGDGSLIAGGWIEVEIRRNNYLNRPAVWRRVSGAWGPAQVYAYPGQAASIYDIAADGGAAGRTTATDGMVQGIVWDNAGTYTVLDGIAYGINNAGTIVVGEKNGPVFWYRTASGAWTTTATPLPVLGAGCTGGRANDVNDAGVVVGGSCVSTNKRRGSVWRLDLSGSVPIASAPSPLPGLGVAGTGEDNTAATAITSTAPYVVVGYVNSGNNITVRWPAP
jgi:hypothetical protein